MRAEALHREDRVGARRDVAEHLAREAQRRGVSVLPLGGRDELEQPRLRERRRPPRDRAPPRRPRASAASMRDRGASRAAAPPSARVRRRRRTSAGRRSRAASVLTPARRANRAGRLSLNAACASAKSGCCMHSAWACASASIASASAIVCSLSIICFVIACANAGPAREPRRPTPARASTAASPSGDHAVDEADRERALGSR